VDRLAGGPLAPQHHVTASLNTKRTMALAVRSTLGPEIVFDAR
jgi:hypothetical protein